MKKTRIIAISLAIILIIVGLFVLLLLAKGLISWNHAEMVMVSLLTFATITYAVLVWLTMDQSKEAAVQPKIVLDIIRLDDEPVGAGIRILNQGNGPALGLRFHIGFEPEGGQFRIKGLEAVTEGLEALASGEHRVLSTGQTYEDLLNQPDRPYVITVSYTSLAKEFYSHKYTVKAPRDRHWLRSSFPIHRQS